MFPARSWRLAAAGLLLVFFTANSAVAERTRGWRSIGPQGGELLGLAVDPHNPVDLYATTNHFVFKSSDRGAHWSVSTGHIVGRRDGFTVSLPLIDPGHSGTVYVGTNRGSILKTRDGGAHWSELTGIAGAISDSYIGPLSIARSNSAVLYVSSAPGEIAKTTDAGASWTTVAPFDPGGLGPNAGLLTVDPTDSALIYAEDDDFQRLFKSTDGGSSWVDIDAGLPPDIFSYCSLEIDAQEPHTLYAGTYDGVYKTTDSGGSWSQLNGLGNDVSCVVADPNRHGWLYAFRDGAYGSFDGKQFFRSTDGGNIWQSIEPPASVKTIITFTIDPSDSDFLYLADETAGIWRSEDGGSHWIRAGGIIGASVTSLQTDPHDAATLYGIIGNEGYLIGVPVRTNDAGVTWATLPLGVNANVLAVDPSHPATIWAGTADGLRSSTDAGDSWPGGTGFSDPEAYPGTPARVYALAIDPANPLRLCTSANMGRNLYDTFTSTDGGTNWEYVERVGGAASFAFDPSDSSVFYAAARDGIVKTTDGGSTWLPTSLTGGRDPFLVVDPSRPSTLYAGTSSIVFRTTDSGQTWIAVNHGFPELSGSVDDQITGLVIDAEHTTTLYAGIYGKGVYRTVDGGTNWTPLNIGLDTLEVTSLALGPGKRGVLYAGTLGRGVYALNVPSAPCIATLCLDDHPGDQRFEVEVHYTTTQSHPHHPQSGDAHPVSLRPLGMSHAGLFRFFDPDRPEMLFKIIDGCGFNGHFWVFSSAVTTAGLTTTVHDRQTGSSKVYENPDGAVAGPVLDTAALPCGDTGRSVAITEPPLFVPAASGGCGGDPASACLAGRFQAHVDYQTIQGGGRSGAGSPVGLASIGLPRSSLFTFFDANSPEMLVQVIDGCPVNGKFWLAYAAPTNSGFTLGVTDVLTGSSKTFTNPDLVPAQPQLDLAAFDCR